MPSDALMKAMNSAHRVILRVSGGKIGWSAQSMPVIELTTIGRQSGQERVVLLTSPVQQGDTLVVVASRGGDDRHPAWYLNLVKNPEVGVVLKGQPKQQMTARVASAQERAELWPQVIKDHKNYAGYQKKTDREIPLILLQPQT
ncbi:MAG: nitroreductase/quinone reductase family protein [Microthrixaceae bacterium]